MTVASTRVQWAGLPEGVRAAVERILGDEVVEARSQPGGFSPGSADRVITRTGRRAFVKAVSSAQNRDSPDVHRREASIAGALPPGIPVPRLQGVHDDGDWVALVFDDVDGHEPALPWSSTELDAAIDALDALADALTPSPLPHAPDARDELRHIFDGWRALRDDPPAHLDPWIESALDRLVALADRGLAVVGGDTLLHMDIRADNVLVDSDGAVWFVDWPWAVRGADWLDLLTLVLNARVYDPSYDADAALAASPRTARVPYGDVTAALAGFAGYFMDGARQPSPPGLPTLRAFQRMQGVETVAWLRERLEHGGCGEATRPR